MASDLSRALRRLKPQKLSGPLRARLPRELPFVDLAKSPPGNLLLDSTVYIDELQGRLPPDAETLLRVSTLWHSPVTAAELAVGVGHLDPNHPKTKGAVAAILQSIERRPHHRVLPPDSEIWVEAGLATGILARLQNYAGADRGRLLNDALLLFTASKHGCTLLTRNTKDFDLLLQIAPACLVLFYTAPR